MNRKTLFPTPVYFKDLPNAKELNKYLFKHIKAWKKADPDARKFAILVERSDPGSRSEGTPSIFK